MPAQVYIMCSQSQGIYKIGITRKRIHERLAQIRYTDAVPDVDVVHSLQCHNLDQAADLEFIIHSIHAEKHVRGEWFKLDASDLEKLLKLTCGVHGLYKLLPVWAEQLRQLPREPHPREQRLCRRYKAILDCPTNPRHGIYKHRQALTAQYEELLHQAANVQKQIHALGFLERF
jgi:hypothetical protein